MKKYTLLLMAMPCLLAMAWQTKAQENSPEAYPDTIEVSLDGGGRLTLYMHNFVDLANMDALAQAMASTHKNLSLAAYEEPVDLVYQRQGQRGVLEVTPKDAATAHIDVVDGQATQPMNTLAFKMGGYRAEVRLQKLDGLAALAKADFKQLLNNINSSLGHYTNAKRKQVSAQAKYSGQLFHGTSAKGKTPLDYLAVTAGAGVGIVRDKLVPELGVRGTIFVVDKYQKPRNRIGFMYTQHYFYQQREDNSYDLAVNDFASVFFGINTAKSKDGEMWYGLGLGYLVRSNGGYFQGNTFKLYAELSSPKRRFLDIMPEVIFNDDFRRVIPGIRFGITF